MSVEPPAWPTPWPQLNRLVEGLWDGLGGALGDELVGLYLSGSLALGGFHPPSSDIDVLVATAGVLDGPAVQRLTAVHASLRAAGGWAARLEVVYLPVATLRRYDPSDHTSYPIAASDRGLALGRQGPTWVLDRWVAREHGLVVAGPRPSTLIDPVGPQALRAAVRGLLLSLWAGQLKGPVPAWLRPRRQQAFAVLSMCRALYCLEHGVVVSKPAAAAWASRQLAPPWPELVARALGWRADPRPDHDGLGATLGLVTDAVARARTAG
jgi:aminoglycoside adenylyltransferase-like protein